MRTSHANRTNFDFILHKKPDRPWRQKKKNENDEFRKILEMETEAIDFEEDYKVMFPKHGKYWDNGYEDLG